MNAPSAVDPAERPAAESAASPLDHEKLRDVVELSLRVGQALLRSGAQASRLERTVRGIASALGAQGVDVLVLPEGVILTTSSGHEFRTRVRRVPALGVDLAQLEAVDQLFRKVESGELDARGLEGWLDVIERARPNYQRWLVVALVGLACAAFARLFGGDLVGCAVTFVAAAAAQTLRQVSIAHRHNALLTVVATAFVAGLVPSLACRVGILPDPAVALAASVLLLVPGVPLINAARDILRGYLSVGSARGAYAAVWTLCIAIGLLVALQTCGIQQLEPLRSQGGGWFLLIADGLWSGVAALGFAVLFNTPPRALVACFAVGAFGHALRTAGTLGGLPLGLGTLLGAIGIGVAAEALARRAHVPVGLYAMPAAIPLVPGVLAFRSMMALIGTSQPVGLGGDTSQLGLDAVRDASETGLVLAAIGIGIALPALLRRRP